jgi:hypothetical protein
MWKGERGRGAEVEQMKKRREDDGCMDEGGKTREEEEKEEEKEEKKEKEKDASIIWSLLKSFDTWSPKCHMLRMNRNH